MLSAVEICRHGARAPMRLFPFNQQYWKPEQIGNLTDVGAMQHYKLGQRLRRRYVDELKLLPEQYCQADIRAIATSRGRTRLSALCQLIGLYQHPADKRLGGKLSSGLPSLQELIDSQVQQLYRIQESDKLLKGYSKQTDPAMEGYYNLARQSSDYLSKEAHWKETLFPEVSRALGMTVGTLSEAASVSSTLDCEVGTARPLPSGVTPEMHTSLQAVHAFDKFEVPFSITEARIHSLSALFTDILAGFRLHDKANKFKLYSAHDTTVAGVLRTFGCTFPTVPGFTSHVLMELDTHLMVTCHFQGRAVQGTELKFPCPLGDLEAFLRPFTEYAEKTRKC